jgi:indole-3-glycerol phosphate synthase
MRQHILEGSGVIAEFKRRSPSKPTINLDAVVEQVTPFYEAGGASGISVLTDSHFFGGSDADIQAASQVNQIPLLRKDFIIDPYQIYEARNLKADCILLIARILNEDQISSFVDIAHSIDLEVLVEVHNPEELEKVKVMPDLIGINNRNLDTFEVDYQQSIDLISQLPSDLVKIAESGISSVEVMCDLAEAGFDGFLIGERFMGTENPGQSCAEMIASYLNMKK